MTLRIAYAGLIQVAAQFSTLFTGLIFVTILTRNLTVDQFGLWQVLGSSVSVALIPMAPISYWALRYLARGDDVGRTAVYGSIIFAPVIVALFLTLVLVLTLSLGGILIFSLVFLPQIPILALNLSLKSSIQASRPQFLGYATIIFELAKVGAILYLVFFLRLGLVGAIVSLTIGHLLHVIALGYWSRDLLKGTFHFGVIRSWIRTSWVPILSTLVARVWIADVILVSVLVGSTVVVGFFQAARTFVAIVALAEVFLVVLYPKLIRDRLGSDVSVSIRLQLLVQLPLAVGAFVMAEPLLGVLRLDYVVSAPILRILVLVTMVQGIEHLMDFVLLGSEKVDRKMEDLRLSSLRKSWLVKLPLIDLAKGIIYFGVIAFTLSILNSQGASEITLGFYWGLIFGGVVVPFTILKLILARKQLPHNLPYSAIAKYIFSGLSMAGFLYFFRLNFPWTETRLLDTLSYLAIPGLASLALYGVLNVTLDSYVRDLVRNSLRSITGKAS